MGRAAGGKTLLERVKEAKRNGKAGMSPSFPTNPATGPLSKHSMKNGLRRTGRWKNRTITRWTTRRSTFWTRAATFSWRFTRKSLSAYAPCAGRKTPFISMNWPNLPSVPTPRAKASACCCAGPSSPRRKNWAAKNLSGKQYPAPPGHPSLQEGGIQGSGDLSSLL